MVVILHRADFSSLDELLRARAAIAAPVLFRVGRDEVDRVLLVLRDSDDVCTDEDPVAIVEHRQRALARRSPPGTDQLTHLMTRASFKAAVIGDAPAALLVINLDRFKQLNDRHGHLVGDDVLREAAGRTRAATPPDGLVSRIAGDVFAVALPDHHDARRVAAAIHAAFHAGPMATGIDVTASIGLVTRAAGNRASDGDFDELLKLAETCVYAAKARGRDQIIDHADQERRAREADRDLELDGFEDMTRVLADRVADVISWRGRRVFQGLRDQADIDALTGLASRRCLDRRLVFDIDHARERGQPLAIGLLDVDHFGSVNKQHGWPTGDRVLADVAARIRDALRASDWAARYGGEEMCIVIDGAGLDSARIVLERVRAAVAAKPFETTQGEPLPITVSIGCAELVEGDSMATLVERASSQLLIAKRDGRDRVR